MKGRALEGEGGDVESDERSVRVSVDVEQAHTPVSTSHGHDGKLRARVPSNIDNTGASVRRLLLTGGRVLLVGVDETLDVNVARRQSLSPLIREEGLGRAE